MKKRNLQFTTCVCLAAMLLMAFNANANTLTWIGAASNPGSGIGRPITTTPNNQDFNLKANWSGTGTVAGADLIFNLVPLSLSTATINTISVTSSISVSSINFTYSGGTITADERQDLYVAMNNTLTVSGNVTFTNNIVTGAGGNGYIGLDAGFESNIIIGGAYSATVNGILASIALNGGVSATSAITSIGGTTTATVNAGKTGTISFDGTNFTDFIFTGPVVADTKSTDATGNSDINFYGGYGTMNFNGSLTLGTTANGAHVNIKGLQATAAANDGIMTIKGNAVFGPAATVNVSTTTANIVTNIVVDGAAGTTQAFMVDPLANIGFAKLSVGSGTALTVNVTGAPFMKTVATPNTLTVATAAIVNLPNGSSLNANATGTTSTLALNGTATLNLGGSNFPNLTTKTLATTSTVTYNGALTQTIGTGFTYGNLTFANTNGGLTYTSGIPSVAGTATFTSGLLDNLAAGSANPLSFLASSAVSGASDASHATGYVRNLGTGAFTYPIGNATNYEPIGTNLTANGSGMLANYVVGNGGTAALTAPLVSYNNREYWNLTPTTTATGTVTAYWDTYNNTGINTTADIANLVVAHYTAGAWKSEGVSGSGSGTILAGSVTGNAISTWSPFTIGSISPTTVLPVTITSFTGTANGCTTNLAWQTATEINSTYYAVEASLDGGNFAQIAKVASKNSATGASYAYGCSIGSGTTYFRLKAVDLDGKFSYSNTVAVTGTGACSTNLSVKVSPNPTSNLLNIQGLASGSHISLTNINGQRLTEVTASGTSQTLNISMYAKGVYILQIQSANGFITNTKVVKQ